MPRTSINIYYYRQKKLSILKIYAFTKGKHRDGTFADTNATYQCWLYIKLVAKAYDIYALATNPYSNICFCFNFGTMKFHQHNLF